MKPIAALILLSSLVAFSQQSSPPVKQTDYAGASSGVLVPAPSSSNIRCSVTDGVNTYTVPCSSLSSITLQGTSPVTVNGDGSPHTGNSFIVACPSCGGSGSMFAGLINTPTIAGSGMTNTFNATGGFTASNVANGINIADSAGKTTSYNEGILATYPASPFTATALVSLPVIQPTTSNFAAIQITIGQNTTTGKLETFGVIWGQSGSTITGSWNPIVDGWTAPTTYGSNQLARQNYPFFNYVWLRLKDDGTNLTFYVSPDGVNFSQQYTCVKTSCYMNGNYNYLGVSINSDNNGTTTPIGTTLMSWQVTTP